MHRVTDLPALPERPADSHKGTFGRVLIVGGSQGMSGAPALAGLGALRGGAGLVFLAAPSSIVPIVAAIEPSWLTIPLAEDDRGRIAAAAREELHDAIARHDAIAIGPGWGQSDALRDLAQWMYSTVDRPLVVDADALNLLAQLPGVLGAHPGPRILTPHPAEFSRLCGRDVAAIQSHREELAAEFARAQGVVLVLKGRGTVVTDGELIAINETGNPGMATGGTGDVLTGLIAALLAQGSEPFAAARLGAHLHGLAGDLAAADLSQPGLIASDVARYLPQAWLELGRSAPPRRTT
ncbi:MAG: NAD(P)H-hydrate dehydratase [Planctomycetaceae bacterium]